MKYIQNKSHLSDVNRGRGKRVNGMPHFMEETGNAVVGDHVMDFTVSQRNFLGKRRIGCTRKNKSIPVFLIVIFALSVISLLFLDISWIKLFSRIPEIGGVFWKLMHFDVSNIDLVTSSLLETLSITVLSTLYSLVLGLIFGVLAAENLFHGRLLSQCADQIGRASCRERV